MSTYQEIYKNLCRICLCYGKSEEMVSLTENNDKGGLSCYGKAVLSFAEISIKTNNNLPCSMCKKCLMLLKQAIYFKFRCEFSEKQLKSCLETYQSTKDIGFNIEEIVIDNIIFTKYFPEECSGLTNTLSCDKSNVDFTRESDYESERNGSVFSSDHDNEKHLQDSDADSSDEILNLMEENIGQCGNIRSTNYKNYMQHKLALRKRRQAKILAIHIKNQQIHNAIRMKRLKMKILTRSAMDKAKLFCEMCNRQFANHNTYRYHMQRHNGYSYICEHCGKGFPVLAELNLHQVARHGTGPYIQCKHCNFKASRKHDLVEHERLHTGERPYTCDKCGLTFRRRAIWRKHMIYHTEKTVQCPQCPKKFFRHSEMLAHMNGMHERLYLYSCHKCDTTYAKTASVRRHLTEKHGIPREEQGRIIRINKRRYEIKKY
ncbi:unnamed protein product [Chilo suppressalis]|uniref:Uncharacterized protein n=1 Tax=Chilo suppressalis TaxID=168631 RepID=A0ABN8B6G1_CHISP|nr:unnamed protein product [Chilo suppressalis]